MSNICFKSTIPPYGVISLLAKDNSNFMPCFFLLRNLGLVDEFCKKNYAFLDKKSLGNINIRKSTMSHSEIITIMILFHYVGYRDFKTFYTCHISYYLRCLFPKTVSYNRFVELMPKEALALTIFLQT